MSRLLAIRPASKVLLIKPSQGELVGKVDVPSGLLAVASYLDANGVDVRIVDQEYQRDFNDRLDAALKGVNIVGISVWSTGVGATLGLLKRIKEANSSARTVVGGWHVTLFPEQTIQYPLIDYAVQGEGEKTFLELIRALESGDDLSSIDGLLYKHGGSVVKNRKRDRSSLAELPAFNWELLSPEVIRAFQEKGEWTITVGRGCSFKCTFCINSVIDQKWQGIEAQNIINEIIHIKTRYDVHSFMFNDDNLTSDRARIKTLVHAIIKQDLKIKWRASLRVAEVSDRFLNDEWMAKLRESGCRELIFGAESGSQRVLNFVKKGIKVEQILTAARQCHKHGIRGNFSFMIGIPTETFEEQLATVELIKKIKREAPSAYINGPQPFYYYPGGVLYEMCKEIGLKEPQSFEEWGAGFDFESFNGFDREAKKRYGWIKNPDFYNYISHIMRHAYYDIDPRRGFRNIFKLPVVLSSRVRLRYNLYRCLWEYKLWDRLVLYTRTKHKSLSRYPAYNFLYDGIMRVLFGSRNAQRNGMVQPLRVGMGDAAGTSARWVP